MKSIRALVYLAILVPAVACTKNSARQSTHPLGYNAQIPRDVCDYWVDGDRPEYCPSQAEGPKPPVPNDDVLRIYPNITSLLEVKTLEATGEIKGGVGSGSVKGESYSLIIDYVQYRSDEEDRFGENCVVLSGVGVRITVRITAIKTKAKVSYGTIGAEAEAGRITGNIEFSTIGISGPLANASAVFPMDLSKESLVFATGVAKALIGQLGDSQQLALRPQVFGHVCTNIEGEPGDDAANKQPAKPAADHRTDAASTPTPTSTDVPQPTNQPEPG